MLKKQWKALKESYSTDLTIRFTKEIQEGNIRLIERENNSWLEFFKSKGFNSNFDKFCIVLSVFLIFIMILLPFFEKNTNCVIFENWSFDFVFLVSRCIFLAILWIYTFLSLCYLACTFDTSQNWQIDKQYSNRFHIVERYNSNFTLKFKKIFYLIFSIFLLIFLCCSIYLVDVELIKEQTFFEINQSMINKCKST